MHSYSRSNLLVPTSHNPLQITNFFVFWFILFLLKIISRYVYVFPSVLYEKQHILNSLFSYSFSLYFYLIMFLGNHSISVLRDNLHSLLQLQSNPLLTCTIVYSTNSKACTFRQFPIFAITNSAAMNNFVNVHVWG